MLSFIALSQGTLYECLLKDTISIIWVLMWTKINETNLPAKRFTLNSICLVLWNSKQKGGQRKIIFLRPPLFIYVGIFALYIFRLSFFWCGCEHHKAHIFLTCSHSGCKHAGKSTEAVCMLVLWFSCFCFLFAELFLYGMYFYIFTNRTRNKNNAWNKIIFLNKFFCRVLWLVT